MKKLLLIAALLLAMSVTAIACTTDGTTGSTDTGTGTTAADTTAEAETTAADSEDTTVPTEETTVPEETTKKPDDETTAPEVTTEKETDAPDPNAPTLMFTAEELNKTVGLYDMGAPVLSEDSSYITITPTGNDPYYYPFGATPNIMGDRFMAIKYRTTNGVGTSIQIYTGSGVLDNDNDMLKSDIQSDGEWHLAIFDLMLLDGQTSDMTGVGAGAGSYDGSTIAFLRLDPMEVNYILDDSGKPYKDDNNLWARYDMPVDAYIDIAYLAFFDTAEKAQAYEDAASRAPDASLDFASDVASQADGTLLNASDLIDIFTVSDPTGGNPAVSGGLYALPASFIHLVGQTDGAYIYTVDIASTSNAGMSGIFVRGYSAAAHEGSYYGVLASDNVNAFGGPGIYLNVNRNPANNSMVLRISIRSVDLETGVLSEHVFEQYIDSSVISVADSGSTVSIMAGDKLIATVAISGEQVGYTNTYMGGTTAEIPAGALATTAVLKLADGTVTTIENAAVAATCHADFGIANRTAAISVAAVSVKPYSTATIPETFTKIDPPVVDENAPLALFTPEILAGCATNAVSTIEVKEEEGTKYLHLVPDADVTPFDPWIAIFMGQENAPYVVITYRTNTTSGGQFFAGHGGGPAGGDTIDVDWNEDGRWHTLLINFDEYEHIVQKNGKINYLRSDFIISNNAGDYFDIQSIAIYETAEKAANSIAASNE